MRSTASSSRRRWRRATAIWRTRSAWRRRSSRGSRNSSPTRSPGSPSAARRSRDPAVRRSRPSWSASHAQVGELEDRLAEEEAAAAAAADAGGSGGGSADGGGGGGSPPPVTGTGWIQTCPVNGPNSFVDSFGDPRPGGRSHAGIDMIAAAGTPVAAVHAGSGAPHEQLGRRVRRRALPRWKLRLDLLHPLRVATAQSARAPTSPPAARSAPSGTPARPSTTCISSTTRAGAER